MSALRTLREGTALSLTTFTIAPVRPAEVNRRTGGVAMTLAPLIGALLGTLIGALALVLRLGHPPMILIGAVCVGVAALLTRGLHLDGLADTIDALGSYRDREGALSIMKSPEVGPFGVAAITLALLIPAAAIAGLSGWPWWRLLLAVAASYATGRAAASWTCRRGIPAARPDGLGALVAGTLRWPSLTAATALSLALAIGADPGHPWRGAVAVLAALALAGLLVWHCTRRFGGVTGDVLGATIELATATAMVLLEVL